MKFETEQAFVNRHNLEKSLIVQQLSPLMRKYITDTGSTSIDDNTLYNMIDSVVTVSKMMNLLQLNWKYEIHKGEINLITDIPLSSIKATIEAKH